MRCVFESKVFEGLGKMEFRMKQAKKAGFENRVILCFQTGLECHAIKAHDSLSEGHVQVATTGHVVKGTQKVEKKGACFLYICALAL